VLFTENTFYIFIFKMFNSVYRAKHALSKVEGTPTQQNPKSEYRKRPRGPKQTQELNPKFEARNPKQNDSQINLKSGKYKTRIRLVWNFLNFDHLKLFRISDFEFRIFPDFTSK